MADVKGAVRADARTPGTGGAGPLNIVILMGDQHRWDALGCAADGLEPWQRTWLMDGPGGCPLVRTPHLDRLAATGARFTQAVANQPVCVPSRHSFLTGMYPHQLGIVTNAHYWPDQPPVPTLPMHLAAQGYHSASVGKMHWKSASAPASHVPDRRGFDFRAGLSTVLDGPTDVLCERFVGPGSLGALGGETRAGYVGADSEHTSAEMPETWLTDQAIAYLRSRAAGDGHKRPFCLLVSLDRPHPPNLVPSDYAGAYAPEQVPLPPRVPEGFREDDPRLRQWVTDRGWGEMDDRELRLSVSRYLANVTFMDECFGRVLTALDELGYSENTIVVLLSDHGELLGERGGGHTKYCLYDSAVRVPLCVRWPGVSRAGLASHAAVELVDLLPTWLDAAGIRPPDYVAGRSLRPLLEGQSPDEAGWRPASLSEQYTAGETPGAPRGQWAVRERRFKLIHRAGARSALYDLQEDPGELRNLIDDPQHAAVRERLYAHLAQGVIERAERYPALHPAQVAVARPR